MINYPETYIELFTIIASILTASVLISGFLEKVFKIDVFGLKILRFIGKVLVFLLKWIFNPILPRLESTGKTFRILNQVSKSDIDLANDVVELNLSRADNKEKIEKVLALVEALSEDSATIKKEVTYNGGSSLKDAVRKNQETLDETVSRLDISDISNDRMIFKINKKGECTFINNAFLDYFGHPENALLGRGWHFCFHPDERDNVLKMWEYALKYHSRYRLVQRIIDKYGNYHTALVQGIPLGNEDYFKGFLGTIDLIKNKETIDSKIIK